MVLDCIACCYEIWTDLSELESTSLNWRRVAVCVALAL